MSFKFILTVFLITISFPNIINADQDRFTLIFEQEISPHEKKLLEDEIERYSEGLTKFFKFEKRTVTIIRFEPNLNRDAFPEWGIGFYSQSENTIFLNMSRYHDRDTFYKVLRHEITHAWSADFRYRRNIWPLWFEEGLAEYASGKVISFNDAKKLSLAIAGNKILSQDSLLSMSLVNPYKIELFYLQSFYIVQSLARDGLLDQYIHGAFWGPSKKTPPGFKDWIDFEIWWQTSLYDHYKWFILLNFDFSIAILFVILLIIVYIITSFRSRQKLKELQSSEIEIDN